VDLALWLGLRLEVFASMRERRDAWERHRDELLARSTGGRTVSRAATRLRGGSSTRGRTRRHAVISPTAIGLPEPGDLDGTTGSSWRGWSSSLSTVTWTSGRTASNEGWAGQLRPRRIWSATTTATPRTNTAVSLIGTAMDAYPAEHFTDLLVERLGWLCLGPGRAESAG
jgi:hypothetical protein